MKKTTKTTKKTAKKAVGKKSKTARIHEYLEKNPEHTWKDAEPALKRFGISSTYYSMIKSKLSQSSKRVVTSRRGGDSLAKAKEFARACGGIDKAVACLKELEKYQV